MRALLFVSLILVSYTDIYGQWLAGYTYRRRIDIHESMIPGISSFSNFPVLIDITNDDFRECPTGYITNHNGWDIRFTASNGTSTLDHDLESYDPVTGRIRAWVRVTVLSATVDTRIYIYFGNQSITTNSSSSATWEVAYRGVWHLNGNLNDATSPSNPGINHGTSDASGFIANGRDFDASASEYIEVPYDNTLDLTQSVTVSAWVRLSANSFDQKIFGNQNDSRGGYKLGIFSDNKVEFETRNNGNDANPLIKSVAGGTVLSTGTWYYVAGVYSDAGDFIRTYVNGNLDRSLSGANSLATTTSGSAAMGRESFASSLFFDGVIDELRVQRTERSADWITAEYNNQSSPATFYTVLDTESAIPVAICKNTSLSLDGSGNATLTVPMVDNGSSSSCGITKTLSQTSFDCSDLGSNVVTLTVDNGYSTATCSSTVTVTDGISPVISNCPSSIVLNNEPGLCGAYVSWTEPGASDNCTSSGSIIWTKSKLPGTYFPVGTTTVTYVAEDASGNKSATCSFTVTVNDISGPVVTSPFLVQQNVATNSGCTYVHSGTGWNASAADNCGVVTSLSYTLTGATTGSGTSLNGVVFNKGLTNIEWTAVDYVGNSTSAGFPVMVSDDDDPVISCTVSGQQNVNVTSGCTYIHSGTGWNATATDNCTNVTLAFSLTGASSGSGTTLAGTVFNEGITTVTWQATDDDGNISQCSFTVKVSDNILPVVSCPSNVTHDNDPGLCSYTFSVTQATATDNCGIDHVTGIRIDGLPLTDPFPSGVTTITWTATDINGNLSLPCTQTVTVNDTEIPDFTVPADITVCRIVDCTYVPNILPSLTGEVTGVSDNCTPPASLLITYTDNLSGITSCDVSGTILRTWKVTDAKDNYREAVQRITVEPVPSATVLNNAPSVCNGGNVNILINSITSPSIPDDLSFDIKITSADPVHISGTAIADFVLTRSQLPYTLNGTLINTSEQPVIVTFTITPLLNGCGNGSPIVRTVTVNPTAVITSAATANWCNNTSNSYTATSSTTGATFTWTRAAIAGISNPDNSGTGAAITETLINTTTGPVVVHYLITPQINGCAGTQFDVAVTVNPTAVVTSAATANWCNNTSNSYIATSSTTGATFTWTRAAIAGISNPDNSGTGAAITETLINTTTGPVVVHYLITPEVNGCAGTQFDLAVTIIPNPEVDQPDNLVICHQSGVPEIIFDTPNTGLFISYSWTNDQASIGLSSSGTGNLPAFTALNPGTSPVVARIQVTPHFSEGSLICDGPLIDFTITVNPTAQAEAVSNQVVCNNAPTLPVIFDTENSGGTTSYTWINDQPSIGLPGSGSGSIPVFTAINTGDSPVVATISVIPHYENDGQICDGPQISFTITVDPDPKVVPSVLTQSLCNNGTTNIIIGSPSTFSYGGITFDYTVTATGGVTGFTTPLTGLLKNHVIADVLVNPTNEPQTVTYTIVPVTSTGCASGPAVVIVTVNPTPLVDKPADIIMCDNETSVPIVLTTTTNGPVFYTWTNDNPSIGLAPSGTGNIPAFTSNNDSDSPAVANISIVPHFNSGSLICDGDPVSFTITVNPTPRIYPVPTDDQQCDNSTTNITLHSPSTFTSGVISFSYTATGTGGISGYNASATGLANGHLIADVLVNPTDEPQDVTYIITPHSSAGCNDGPAVSVTVRVNPTPRVFPVPVNTVQCDSATTNIVLQSPSIFTSGAVTFRYTATGTGGVSGFSSGLTDLPTGYTISDRLINPTDAPQMVSYVIVPVSPAGCGDGPVVTVTVTVNPTPRINPVPGNIIQCDNITTNIPLVSPSIFTSGVVTINYTASAPAGLSGYTPVATGLPSGSVIQDNLVNSTDAPLNVAYTLIPVSGVSCNSGTPVIFTVTVNPTPRVTPVNVKPAICYADLTDILLASPTIMTSGEIKFDYTITLPSGVTGNSSPGTDLDQGTLLSFQYRNTNDTVLSAVFSVIPKVNGLSCAPGTTVDVEVRLHPRPVRGITITKPFTCEASTGLAGLRADISRGADPYEIIWRGPVGYEMQDSVEINNLYAGYYTLNVTDNLGCAGDTAINIANLSASPRIIPLPVLPGIHVACPGGSTGTARIYVRDGITAPYTYELIRNDTEIVYNGVFTANYDPLDPNTYKVCENLRAGRYKLVIHDINGCETIRTAELLEPEPIGIDFDLSDHSGYNISCHGYSDGYAQASVAGGNGGYIYHWYPESGSLTVSTDSYLLDSIPAGKYFLSVTDILGCSRTDSVILTDPPGMSLAGYELSHSNDNNYEISCYGGSDGYINLNITGGSGNNTYLWVGPDGFSANTRDLSGLKAGIYTSTITDINGCILVPQPVYELYQPDEMIISNVVSVSADGSFNISCPGGTGSVDITVTGGSTGNYTYNWTTANGGGIVGGSEDQTLLLAGDYHLTVTDINGCQAYADITLSQPEELITELIPSHITCQSAGFDNGAMNLNISGGIQPYSYLWSNGEMIQDITGLTEGYYSVTVTDLNGCTITDSARVNLPPPLSYNKVLSDYNGFNTSCYGRTDGSIRVTPVSGTAPYIFNWQGPGAFSSTLDSISGLSAGSYVLTITDSKFCTVQDTIELVGPGRLQMDVLASKSVTEEHNINCSGQKTGSASIQPVNNAGPVHYFWSDGETGSERTGLAAGPYKVIIIDSNGCSADSVITLTEPEPLMLSFTTTSPLCTEMPDGTISLAVIGGTNAGYTYLWSDNSTGQNISNATGGQYLVTVTDLNACIATGSVMVVPVNDICLDIPNAISPNGDLINDVWNIGFKELYPDMEIKIFNRWGELIWKSDRGYPVPWDGRSRGAILPVDSYHYTINLHNGSKIIIGHITIVK